MAAEAPPQPYAAEAPPQPQPYATAQPVYGQPAAQPVYSQPAPVAMPPAAPQTVQVQVPAGMMPGSVFNVQANGQMIPVTVPMGCKPGGLLTVQVPPRAVAVQQPVVQQPGQTIVVQQVAGRAPPRGAPAGGVWCQRPFCGPITILIAIFLAMCVLLPVRPTRDVCRERRRVFAQRRRPRKMLLRLLIDVVTLRSLYYSVRARRRPLVIFRSFLPPPPR